MENKIVGYILITLGIGIILFSAFSMYRVFTGSAEPIGLFTADSISIDLSSMVGGEISSEGTVTQGAGPSIEILEAEILNKSLNTVFYTILMFFMVTVGAKIATIGTYLVRTIKVNLKEENTPQVNKS